MRETACVFVMCLVGQGFFLGGGGQGGQFAPPEVGLDIISSHKTTKITADSN